MKAFLTTTILTITAFGSSGCAVMIGDTTTGYSGYMLDNGRCSHKIESYKQPDGVTKTVRTSTCKPAVETALAEGKNE